MLITDNTKDKQLVELLKNSAVGVLPTDTLYGLVGRAADKQAAQRLYGLKKRGAKPGTVIAANTEQLVELGIKPRYLKAVQHFWPGPISIVIPCIDLDYLHLGKGSLALRIPDDKQLIALLRRTGPLLTTSANQPGKPPANNLAEAKACFGESVDFYVDGGDLSERQPSTVIRIVDDAIEILRSGATQIDETGKIRRGTK